MQKKYTPKEYCVVPLVYANYHLFQGKLSSSLKTYTKKKPLINILEIGCGTGITTQVILKSRTDINLVSIDNDSRMIKCCNSIKKTHKNFETLKSDALEYLKLVETDFYDIIVSGFTIHNFHKDYRNSLYRELYRIMSGSSVFLNADKYVSDNLSGQVEGLKYRLGTYTDYLIKEQKYELLKKWVVHYIEDFKPDFIMKFNEELEIMYKSGFSKVSYISKSEIEMIGLLKAIK